MNVLIAICCATIAACGFAVAATLQHGAVRASTTARSISAGALLDMVRTRGWLTGTTLAVVATGLHITALSLAPISVVQPIGVLSLVVTVLIAKARRTAWAAVIALCVGVTGFVGIQAAVGTTTPATIPFGTAQLVVLAALAIAAIAPAARGRSRCLAVSASAAVLFGSGASLVATAATDVFTLSNPLSGAGLAAESALLIILGGWFLHQAYAAGPTAVVIATTTVLDPTTAVVIGLLLYGEGAAASTATVVAQLACAGLAVFAVLMLARAIGDQRPVPARPSARVAGGLRILVAADTFPPDVNGAAHFAYRLCHGLAERGHEVHVVCPSPNGTPYTERNGRVTVHRLNSLGTPVHPTFRICLPWHTRAAVPRLIAELHPDIVHVQAHFAVGRRTVSAAVDAAIPVVATNHFMPENLIGYGPIPRVLHAPIIRMAWWDLIRIYRKASVITAPTQRAVRLLADSGLVAPALAISCGIDLGHYRAPVNRAHTETMTVLFVGRLDAEKHLEDLIRALAGHQKMRVELVGAGSCENELRAVAEQLGVAEQVTFRGFVSDSELIVAYQRADVFCMPGTAELQSLATMEAMAAGLPVVAAYAMALPHLVRHGVNGFLYQPGDHAQLGTLLGELERNIATRHTMGIASTELIAEHDHHKTLGQFEHIYHEASTTIEPTPALVATPELEVG